MKEFKSILTSPEFTPEEKLFLVAVLSKCNTIRHLTSVSANLTPLLSLLGRGYLVKARNGRIVPAERLKAILPNKETNPAASRLLNFYYDEYQRRFGRPPAINWSRETVRMKHLLQSVEERVLMRAINAFLEDEDAFLRKTGHSLSAFYSRINGYLSSEETKPTDPEGYAGGRVL